MSQKNDSRKPYYECVRYHTHPVLTVKSSLETPIVPLEKFFKFQSNLKIVTKILPTFYQQINKTLLTITKNSVKNT